MIRLILHVTLVLIGALATAGCGGTTAAQTSPEETGSRAAESIRNVTAGKLQRKTLQRVTVQPGRVQAFEETPLFAKVAGYVEEVGVDIGDRVEAGQVLVRLSVPELRDEVNQREALVAQAEAEIHQAEAAARAAEAGQTTARAAIREAEAGVSRAEADHQRWQSEYARVRQLAESGSVTAKLADETLNQARAAQAARLEAAARVESAQAGLVQSEADVAQARADQRTAEARLRVAQAQLARANTMLGYTEIRAPFEGIVTSRRVDKGHYVQPNGGSNPLLVIVRAEVVRVFIDVPELEAPLVDAGDAAIITAQADGGRQIEGKVTRTSWILDATNRSLVTEIDLPNEKGLLRPGMYATASILLDHRDDALAIPVAALVRDAGGDFCYCVRDGRAVRTPVALGLRSGGEYEVRGGLKGDELVVLAHAESLRDGEPVQVLDPQGP